MKSKILFFIVFVILILGFISFHFGQNPNLDENRFEDPSTHIAENKNFNKNSTNTDQNFPPSSGTKSLKYIHSSKIKKNQIVVDQTLKRINSSTNVEGSSDNIEIVNEIILVDGVTNQVLKNYSVVAEYSYDKFNSDHSTVNMLRLQSDNNGKIIFKSEKCGILNLVIFTDEYSVFTKRIFVGFGKNEYKAQLYKGGILEILAVNEENETIKNLVVEPQSWIDENIIRDNNSLKFDTQKNRYFLSNLLGTIEVLFEAEDYLPSSIYQIKIAPNQLAFIEVKLQKPRKIFIDLDIDIKPKQIKVSKCIKTKTFDGSEEVQKEDADRQKIELLKNKNDLFELQLSNKDISSIVVFVEGYVSQVVRISPDLDIYQLHLEKCYEGKLKLINYKGEPIAGAEISYFVAPMFEEDRHDFVGSVVFSRFKLAPLKINTDENGIAIFKDLKQNMNLSFNVSHKDYTDTNFNWVFDSRQDNIITTILTENITISGTIISDAQPVLGAKVVLIYNGEYKSIVNQIETNLEGEYSFKLSSIEKSQNFLVKAFHQKYGIGSVPLANKDLSKPIDIFLSKEKSILIKLVDEKGLPLANKRMSILNLNLSFQFNFLSNIDGEYEFYNLEHGDYLLRSNDDLMTTIGSDIISFVVPSEKLVVGLQNRNLRKVNVKLPNGEIYKGQINVSVLLDGKMAYDFKYDSNENRLLDFGMGSEAVYILEAPGYATVKLGPFYNSNQVPKEVNIDLLEGVTLKVKVVDYLNNKPLSYIPVNISDSSGFSLTLPTNQKGEAFFTNLNGLYDVIVKENYFVSFKKSVDIAQTESMEISLISCGRLKCRSKPRKAGSLLCFRFGDERYTLDANGNVVLDDLKPGSYAFTIEEIKSTDLAESQTPKVWSLEIESNKTTEIDLDEYLNK